MRWNFQFTGYNYLFLLLLVVSISACNRAVSTNSHNNYSNKNSQVCAIVDKAKCDKNFCKPGYKTFENWEIASASGGYDFLTGDCDTALLLPTVPSDWVFRILPDSNIELSLPPNAKINAKYLNSNKKGFFEQGPFFSWMIEKSEWNKSTDDFLDAQCAGATTFAFSEEKGDYQGSYSAVGKFVSGIKQMNNGFEVAKFQPKCANMMEFLIRYNNVIYVFSSLGENSHESEERFERSILNARVFK